MKNLEEGFEVLEEHPKTQMISKLKFLSLRVDWILISFWNDYTLWNGFLIAKTFQMTRK